MSVVSSLYNFLPEQNITNSFEGLEPERVNWEKKIGCLLIFEKFNRCYGSSEDEKKNMFNFTRNDIKNFLETHIIEYELDWIKQEMPDKIIEVINENVIPFSIKDKILDEPTYIETVNPIKYKLLIEKYKTLSSKEKIIIFGEIIKTHKTKIYCGNKKIYDLYLSTINEDSDEFEKKINSFFDDFDHSKENNLLNVVNKLFSETTTESTINDWKKKFELAKNINDLNFLNKFNLVLVADKLNKLLSDDEKNIFVDNYFISSDLNTICNICDDVIISMIFKDIYQNKEFVKINNKTKLHLFKTKYSDELKDKKFMISYFLDYDSHWELYKKNEKMYLKILNLNNLIYGFIFDSYHFNNFSFLDNFNDEVKNYLKDKIISDTKRYKENEIKLKEKISTIDNLIDVLCFTWDPPDFLRSYEKIYPECESNERFNEYLKTINYDFNKKSYLNMKPKIIFETC